MLVTLFGIVTSVRPVQYENAEFPMPFTVDGIVTEVRFLQDENTLPAMPLAPVRSRLPEGAVVFPTAQPSTIFTPGIVVVSKTESLHPENAERPTLVTLSGIVTFVMFPAEGSKPQLKALSAMRKME